MFCGFIISTTVKFPCMLFPYYKQCASKHAGQGKDTGPTAVLLFGAPIWVFTHPTMVGLPTENPHRDSKRQNCCGSHMGLSTWAPYRFSICKTKVSCPVCKKKRKKMALPSLSSSDLSVKIMQTSQQGTTSHWIFDSLPKKDQSRCQLIFYWTNS